MTDSTSTTDEAPRRKRKGPGSGKVAPAFVLNGSNVVDWLADPPAKLGRPSEYTPERGAYICDELVKGRSLNSILQDEGTPCVTAVYNWLAAYPDFAERYARAREIGCDVFADKLRARTTNVDPERVQSVRLELEYGKWWLGKISPRRFGDRVDIRQEVSGVGGGAIAIDVLHSILLKPEVLDRLAEDQIAALRSTIALLAAPASPAANGAAPGVIDGECSEIDPAQGGAED